MELASMLAGERFSDHPRSVCPVIAAFLRCYNDRVDDRRRQDLYQYAALAVGTRASRATRRARIELCRRFAESHGVSDPWPAPGLLWVWEAERAGRLAGTTAALSHHAEAHSTALALLDTLIACRRDDPTRRPPGPGAPSRAARAAPSRRGRAGL
jgi:hypothetical protein